MRGEEYSMDALGTIADYQFGAGAGDVLFPADEEIEINRSKTGRPRQVIAGNGRIGTFTTAGLFTLGIEGGRRLHAGLEPPAYRVYVGTESEPFVRDGQNVFAKFVLDADPVIRPKDEVLVISRSSSLLGVGRAELSAQAMHDFDRGMAVKVREGCEDE